MKLLLTANGLSNQSIAKALFELVGKPAAETTIVFIPTAVNMAGGDKGWFIDDLYNIRKQGCKYIDIVDVSAIPQSVWQPRIEKGDVLFFSGGNTSHLMRCLKESGLFALLPELLKTRVYAGISAGTMVASPTIALSNEGKKISYEKLFGYRSEEALNFVDFYVRPHFNSPDYPYIQKEYLEKIAQKVGKPVYALDNESALKVIGGNIEVITEGEYLKLS